jgi:hypothetical protein
MRKLLVTSALLLLAACAANAPAPAPKSCVVGGCSSQLCVDAAMGDVASTCEWRAAYGCYKKHSTCEVQPSGECGWTPTDGLQQCLAAPEDEFPL